MGSAEATDRVGMERLGENGEMEYRGVAAVVWWLPMSGRKTKPWGLALSWLAEGPRRSCNTEDLQPGELGRQKRAAANPSDKGGDTVVRQLRSGSRHY